MLNKIKNLIFNYELLVPVVLLIFIVIFMLDIQNLPAAARRMPALVGPITFAMIVALMIIKRKEIFNISGVGEDEDQNTHKVSANATKKVGLITTIIIFYLAGIHFIGYFISTFVMIIAATLLLGEKNYLGIAVTSILFSVVMYLVFVVYFSLRLPSGLLF